MLWVESMVQLNALWLSPSCLISGALLGARSALLPGEQDNPTRPSVLLNEVPAFFLSFLQGGPSEVRQRSSVVCAVGKGSQTAEPF